jgi:DNA-binding response OmpR family regulator
MDIQMPELNGLDASRKIRALESGRHVPIVALSANVFSSDRENCRDAGMNDFLAKPVLPDALYVVLAKYLPAADSPLVPKPADQHGAWEEKTSVVALREEIDTLAELLQTGDIEATHLFNRLQTDLKHYCPAECELMHHKIAMFDFDGTLTLIERIKKTLT